MGGLGSRALTCRQSDGISCSFGEPQMSDESAKSTTESQGRTRKMNEIETLIEQFYSAFDNRYAQVPNSSALRARFSQEATITLVTTERIETWTADEFILPRIRILTDGTLTDFHEWEVAGKTVVFDQIASRCSEYR